MLHREVDQHLGVGEHIATHIWAHRKGAGAICVLIFVKLCTIRPASTSSAFDVLDAHFGIRHVV
eukprot:3977200-Pleurochrysis_carterae.AAC.1